MIKAKQIICSERSIAAVLGGLDHRETAEVEYIAGTHFCYIVSFKTEQIYDEFTEPTDSDVFEYTNTPEARAALELLWLGCSNTIL